MPIWVLLHDFFDKEKRKVMRKLIFLVLMMMGVCALGAYAQGNDGEKKPLFAYPQAPDTIVSFQDRANYVVIRFWNKIDLSRPITDEPALETALQDFIGFFPYAHKTVVVNAIRDLMNKAQSNKTNFAMIGRLAEKNMYSDEAIFASDEAYLPFAEAMVRSKQMKKNEREYYAKQIEKINRNALGAVCPDMEVVDVNGTKKRLIELAGDSTTVLFFNDGKDVDNMIARARLSTSVWVNELIASGRVKVVCVTPAKYSEEWATEARTWANNWEIVAGEKAKEVFDIRVTPSVFILNADKQIVDKNVLVDALIR